MSTLPDISGLLRPLRDSPKWPESLELAVLEPFVYGGSASKPSKEIRSLLIEAFNVWLEVPHTHLSTILRIVRMLHGASLMVDDIEDNAQLRKGQPVVHRIYGVPQTINTANYVYFLAYKEIATLRDRDLGGADRLVTNKSLDLIIIEELLSHHRGQGLEIFWRDMQQCPTEEEYIAMVNNKTGSFFRIGVKLMMACATKNVTVDYVPLVNMFGVYFQIRNDYMNLQTTENSENKGLAEDLTEGKFSFPVVHGVRADQGNCVVLNVLQKRPTAPTLKNYTISHLRDTTGSFNYTLRIMRALEQEIRDEVARLGGNDQLEAVLATLHVGDDK